MSNRQVVVQTPDGRTVTLPAGTPDEAPLPHYDVMADDLTLDDVLPDRYFNRENVRRLAESAGGELVLTFAQAKPEYVYDPEQGEGSGDWPLVVSFHDSPTKLVLNKTRANALARLAGTRSVKVLNATLAGLRMVLDVATIDGHEQVTIAPAEKEPADLDGVNEDLFG